MNRDQLFLEIKTLLVEQFEIEESIITLDANIYEEMEVDSIDAVDLMVHIKELTGKKIPPDQFKEIRTIEDVLNALTNL